MEAGQGPAGAGVIECPVTPGGRVMALLTGLREIGLNVTGVIRVLEVREVAGYASCAGQIVVSVDVALGALHSRMRASQGESGLGVIELCRLPCPSVVALLAGLRESLLHVVRIGRALEVLEVTGHARRCRQIVLPVNVTLAALHSSVRTS